MNNLSIALKQGDKIVFALLFLLIGMMGCSKKPAGNLIETGSEQLETQVFKVDMEKGDIVFGKNGTMLAIPAGSMIDSMGNTVSGQVEVHLKEAFTMKDMFFSGLQTMSDQGLLTTDGSYEIEAFQNGKQLKLDPSVGIYAYFPTDGEKDKEMGLYAGNMEEGDVKWKLTGQGEEGLETCDKDKKNRKRCRSCKYLMKIAKKGDLNKKPEKNNEYWAKRHYWENGVLYYYSSGSAQPIMSKKRLEECREYLQKSDKGRELLAAVDDITRKQIEDVGNYYAFRIQKFGWYNIDKLVKAELVAFNGKIVDEDGDPVEGAKVHLFSKENKIHLLETAEDGSFTFRYQRGEKVMLYAHQQNMIGKQEIVVPDGDNGTIRSLAVNEIEPSEMDHLLADLM